MTNIYDTDVICRIYVVSKHRIGKLVQHWETVVESSRLNPQIKQEDMKKKNRKSTTEKENYKHKIK